MEQSTNNQVEKRAMSEPLQSLRAINCKLDKEPEKERERDADKLARPNDDSNQL